MGQETNLFYNFKDEYIKPVKDLLDKYSIQYIYDEETDNGGYFIRDGVVKIVSPNDFLKLGHELSHIYLINNFEKLLIDNWAMPIISNKKRSYVTGRKYLLMESRVWGTENFLYKTNHKRQQNDHFINEAIHYKKDEFNEVKENVIATMKRHENNMTLKKFLSKLEIRFQFLQNYIKNNPCFNSKTFDLWNDLSN